MAVLPGDIDLPADMRGTLSGYTWQRQTIGRSDADVYRLEADRRPTLFLKTEPSGPFAELADEAARLQWLAGNGVSCPRVVAMAARGGRNWLLMSAVRGRDLASLPHVPPRCVVEVAANALRDLHGLEARTCPFDHRLDQRLALARARMEAGVVDETDFDEPRKGRRSRDLFGELAAHRPDHEDLVVAHGDACLPNFMMAGGRFAGFVDCSRVGVADRYQDIALAYRSIGDNLGEAWAQPFLDLYGLPYADPAKLSYYQLLDEFF